MDLQKIFAFIEAAKCLNFTAAAYRLFITPSSLSKYISQLESSLGFPLFVRNKRNVKLTPAGEYLLTYFEKMMSDIQSGIEYARIIADGKRCRIRFGLHGFTNIIPELGELLLDFLNSYPQYSFDYTHLSLKEMRETLINQTSTLYPIDAVITKRHKIEQLPDCRYKTLSSCRFVCVARLGHEVFKKHESPSLVDLKDYTFITLSDLFTPQMNDQFEILCANLGFTPRMMELDKPLYNALLHATTSDDIAIASEAEAFPYTSLRAIPLDGPPFVETVVAWNQNVASTELQDFIDFIDTYNQPSVPDRT